MSTKPLIRSGMDLDIPALRPARQRAAGHALRLLEQDADILAHPLDPRPREGALERDDAVAVEAAHDRAGVVNLLFGFRRRRHRSITPPLKLFRLIYLYDDCEAANRPPMSENARFAFEVEAAEDGEGTRFEVRAAGGRETRAYRVPGGEQADYAAFYRELAARLGHARPPRLRRAASRRPRPEVAWRPLLTDNISPRILAGYGDPAVLKTDEGYVLVATSNDAPDAFPILRSDDLEHWQHAGFVFPGGRGARMDGDGRRVADFWAPEMARVGDEYWLAYTARQTSNALAIGLAKSAEPVRARGATSAGRCSPASRSTRPALPDDPAGRC